MFIQVIRGKVGNADAARSAFERWNADLRPGATGFLGSTAGVADDGSFVAVARFGSEDAARRNSDRPEQSAWWDETSKVFDGEPAFHDCREHDLYNGGGSNDAGFVQVMVYKPKDLGPVREMAKKMDELPNFRPDVLGSVTAYAEDGTVIDVIYFTNEADAREGEKQEMPAEMQEMMQDFGSNVGEITYVDLKDPWLT